MRRLLKPLCLSLAMGLAACTANAPPTAAAAAAAGGRQCFNARTVDDFRPVNDQTVLVAVGNLNWYELQIAGVCPDINWTERIALRATSGSNWVCEGMDAEMIVPSHNIIQHCPVLAVRRLSPAEVQALRARKYR